jgi:polysaccharide pyruvyl transferase WcaK-like protein
MMSSHRTDKYLALFGAYERDNFGDILFLKVYERLLQPWPIVALSLLSRDMEAEGAGTVIGAPAWFAACGRDFLPKTIIVAGGEVLTSPVSSALACGMGRDRNDAFYRMDTQARANLAARISDNYGDLAYVPGSDLLAMLREYDVNIALNSIGGSSFEGREKQLAASADVICAATYASVRDAATRRHLMAKVDECTRIHLDPDVVTTLKNCYQSEIDSAFSSMVQQDPILTGRYLVFQANDAYLNRTGLPQVAQAVASVAVTFNLDIVLQPAGVAAGHDSIAALTDLAARLQALSPVSVQVQVQPNREIWRQVAVIAHTACFVGTSLHGRIVAAAFARPRVSLANAKVSAYASTWEDSPVQPHDISIDDLGSAVGSALGVEANRLAWFASSQAELALAGLSRLRDVLGLIECDSDLGCLKTQIERVRRKALLLEATRLQQTSFDLGLELFNARQSQRTDTSGMRSVMGLQKGFRSIASRLIGRLSHGG